MRLNFRTLAPWIMAPALLAAALGMAFPAMRRAAASPATSAPSAASAAAPNIVLILTDDQDVQLGSVNYMANVQSLLEAQGTTFDNYFVPLSLCCPSRTTILRGQFPHNTGVLGNSPPNGGFETAYAEKLETATVATLLHSAGYRTVLMGKYLNGYPDTASTTYIPPGWDEWYSPAAGNPYSEYNYTLNENGTLVQYGATPADYLTDVLHAKAVDFIKRSTAANPAQPIFMYVATYAPHSPYTPAPRHANLFPNVMAPRPPSFNEPDVTGKPNYIANKPFLPPATVDQIDSDYRDRARALQAVDEAVADVLATLSAAGRLANTYVVFASDNGYHMGEHRLNSGKYTPYETDIRVPLVIRGPGVPAGAVRHEFAANLDLEATFADFAGVAPQPFSDGRSLKPLFAGRPPQSWRQAFLLEEFNQGEAVPPDDIFNPLSRLGIREPPDPQEITDEALNIPSYYGYQAATYKYITYLDKTSGAISERELYATWDPFEVTNLAPLLDATTTAAFDAYLKTMINCKTDGCRTAEAVASPPLPASLATPLATPIPAGFFAMSTTDGSVFPKVPIGALAHLGFAWGKIEPSRGSFDFSAFDSYMAEAQQHGLVDASTNTASMAITLAAGTPNWAVADQSTCGKGSNGNLCTAPPDKIQDWTDFVTAVVQHYNGKIQPHIRYYEPWNEININLWWTGTDAQMVALARAAYPVVHQDPYAMLLTPSVAGSVGPGANSAATEMTSYLQAGGSQFADGGAFHGYIGAQSGVPPFPMPEQDETAGCKPYVTCYGSVVTRSGRMRGVFDQNGLLGKPMFQTEGSWGNATITDSDTQVAWLARFVLLQAGLRPSLNLQMAAWFAWSAPGFGWGDIATANLDPTPAGVAWGQVYNWLVGATIAEPCAGDGNNTWTCALTRPGNYTARAVWNTVGPFTYTPGPDYTQYRDLAGNTTAIGPGAVVTIGTKPILIEGRGRSGPGVVPFHR